MPLRTSTGKILYLPEDQPLASVSYLWELVAGLPTPLAWWQPKADSLGLWVPTTIAESYTNVATPGTYNAAPGTAPEWAANTGWTFNGLTHYLTTGVVPASGYSMLVCFSGFTAGDNKYFCGEYKVNAAFMLGENFSVNTVRYFSGQVESVSPRLAAGCVAVCGQQGYRNGASDGAAIGAWTTTTASGLYIGAYNNDATGAALAHIAATETLVAVWSSNIAAYMASLYTVLQAAGLTT